MLPPPLPSLSASSPRQAHPSRGFRSYPQAQGFHVSSAAQAPQVPDPQPLPVGPLSHWPADTPPAGPSRVGHPSLSSLLDFPSPPARSGSPRTCIYSSSSSLLGCPCILSVISPCTSVFREKIVSSQGHWVRGGWGFWPSAEP